MPTITEHDFIHSIADALQHISYYHPLDYIHALADAYEREQGPAAKDAIAQILTDEDRGTGRNRPALAEMIEKCPRIAPARCPGEINGKAPKAAGTEFETVQDAMTSVQARRIAMRSIASQEGSARRDQSVETKVTDSKSTKGCGS